MKKLVFFAFIFMIILLSVPTKGMSDQASSNMGYQVIPDDAIRLRILANSDRETDQHIKRLVRDEVNQSITKWVTDITDIEQARVVIQERLPEIRGIVADVLKEQGHGKSFQVTYGTNVTFPHKLYGNYIYPAGEYEAVLITIGAGEGANWWCVLFPPLCFLDFSNGISVADSKTNDREVEKKDKVDSDEKINTTENTETEKDQDGEGTVEIKFFLFEWFDWL